MADPENNAESIFHPGEIIEFADITELSDFEDLVATEVDPTMRPSDFRFWQSRVALKEMVRPPKFNGTINDVRMEVMSEPFKRLYEVKDSGRKFVDSSGPFKRADSSLDLATALTRGFIFNANIKSTGVGTVSTLQSELFYAPVLNRYSSYGTVRRFVARPVFDDEALIKLDERSKRIGFETLRRNMMHPLIAPHRS